MAWLTRKAPSLAAEVHIRVYRDSDGLAPPIFPDDWLHTDDWSHIRARKDLDSPHPPPRTLPRDGWPVALRVAKTD